jgi:hypothetical protein
MERIGLNPELKNYIEKLVYEEFRYNNLLNSVTKDYMSEEEWQSSLNYYTELYDISNLKKQFALEEIVNMYKDSIKCKNWYIDFVNCCLVILENDEQQEEVISNEDYQDYLARLYVDEFFDKNEDKTLKINSNHVKNITFQVTEACNMACTYCY